MVSEPLFWALISMFGLVGACAVVGTERVGRSALAGGVIVLVFDLGRFMLVFPEQTRLAAGPLVDVLGGALLIVGGYVALAPCLLIRPLNSAESEMPLVTDGLYGVVRNPIYLGELLWCLGWALLYHSLIGVALVPLWWAGLLFLIIIEEERLERVLGAPYRAYKQQVRGRIVPGLPV